MEAEEVQREGIAMTKGELRKARKRAVAEGRDWHIETAEGGGMEIVHSRTRREESKHQDAMDQWARRQYERD